MDINTIFDGLDTREITYVQARANSNSDSEALRVCGYSRGWLQSHDKNDLNDRALSFKSDSVLKAQMELDKALPTAALGLVKLLESRNENIRIKAQTEIMDRRMGKPTQRQEITGSDGSTIIVKLIKDGD